MSPDYRRPGTTREQIDDFVRRQHPGAEPESDPPPSSGSATSLIKALSKKLGPWVALGTVLTTAGGWIFGMGRKTAEIPTKADMDKISSTDFAVHQDQSSRLESIGNRLAAMEEHQRGQDELLREMKAELKELRSKQGFVVTSPEKKHGSP